MYYYFNIIETVLPTIGFTLSEQVYVTVRRVMEHQRPALVITDIGTLQLKRKMSKEDSAKVLRTLHDHEGTNIPCPVRIVRQTRMSGGRHTLLSIERF